MSDVTLSAQSTIAQWLADPVGGELLRGMLAQGGQTADALAPVASFTLAQVSAMSGGQFPQSMVDALVAGVGGDPAAGASEAGGDPAAAPPAEAAPAWVEKPTAGRFAGKTVIVAGAGSGIGRAVAVRIAREGGRVVAVDVVAERLDQLAADLAGTGVVTVVADLAKPEDIARILEASGDTIDGLANVAGIMDDFTGLHEVSDAVWDRVFAVNVDGLMRLSRPVLAKMYAAKRGAIVNVTSEAGLRGSAAGVAYTASKHAVIGITRSAAHYYARAGIRVNAVAPGATATNIQASFNSALATERVVPLLSFTPPIAQPEELAASITYLLSDDAPNLTGVILPSDGGWSVQ